MSVEAYLGVSLALLAVALVAVVVRFWKLRRVRRNVAGAVSDVLCVAGLMALLATGSLFVFLLFEERRIEREDGGVESNPMDKPLYLAIQFFSEFGYRLQIWLLKFSYLFFFWSLFKRLSHRHIWTIHLIFVTLICTFLAVLITLFINCQPITRHWSPHQSNCPYTETTTTLKLTTFSNIGTYVILLIPPTLLLITSPSDFRPTRLERSTIVTLYLLFLAPLASCLIRYIHLHPLTTLPPIPTSTSHLTTLLTLLEPTLLLLPLSLLTFLPSVTSPPTSPYTATLILPPTRFPSSSSTSHKRRSTRLPLGFPSKSPTFHQKSYSFDSPHVLELGDAIPGLDYKIYSPDALTANLSYTPPQIATPTPPPSNFSPPPPSSMYSTPYVSPRIGTSGYIRTPSPPPIPSRDETRAGRQSATSQRSGRSHRSRFEKIRERIEQEATSQRSSPASKRSSPVGLEGLVRGQHVRAESASTVRSPVGSPLSFNSPLGSPVGSPTQAQAQMGVGKRGTFGVGEPMSPVTREARLQFYRGGGQ